MIKLIIFDLDGVLVDTEHQHRAALTRAINIVTGVSVSELYEIFRIDGTTTAVKLALLKSTYNLDDATLCKIDSLKQSIALDLIERCLESAPYHYDMLSSLSEKYAIALASNSRRDNVDFILDTLGIAGLFSVSLSGDDVINHKPNPEIFTKIMSLYHISPEETLILEDSVAGKAAAKMSGAHLFEVNSLTDVTLENIEHEIQKTSTNHRSANGRDGLTIH